MSDDMSIVVCRCALCRTFSRSVRRAAPSPSAPTARSPKGNPAFNLSTQSTPTITTVIRCDPARCQSHGTQPPPPPTDSPHYSGGACRRPVLSQPLTSHLLLTTTRLSERVRPLRNASSFLLEAASKTHAPPVRVEGKDSEMTWRRNAG